MDRKEYLRLLDEALAALLPDVVREELLAGYQARFDEVGAEGEAELIAELGDPAQLARSLAAERVSAPAPEEERGLNRRVHPIVAAIIIVSVTAAVVVGALTLAITLVGGR